MTEDKYLEMPTKCPVTGGELYVSELACEESGVVVRGKFRLPQGSTLDPDQQAFLQVFLRARGVITNVEKELGISYPTVRARLDSLLEAMGLAPMKEDLKKKEKDAAKKRQILQDLEDGKISAAEAKSKLRGLNDK